MNVAANAPASLEESRSRYAVRHRGSWERGGAYMGCGTPGARERRLAGLRPIYSALLPPIRDQKRLV